MLINTVVNYSANRGILVNTLKLIQERNHMLVNTVISHVANSGI